MENKVDWIVEYVSNNVKCDVCKKQETIFPPGICDAHTHGMDKYGHLEFQVVIDYGPEEISRLLNTMAMKVKNGEKFQSGDVIEDLYLDCDVTLEELPDCIGNPVLRLLVPDKHNRMPYKSSYPHVLQIFETRVLLMYRIVADALGTELPLN